MRLILASMVFVLIVGTPFAYRSFVSTKYRNLRVVDEGKLYRSGQMSEEAFERTCREYGIGTVITLRDTKDETGKNDDDYEPRYCAENNIGFYRFPPGDWSMVNGEISGEKNLVEFFRILRDPNTKHPVLIHCFAGIHRTGAHVAAYRMECNNWSPEQAVREMKSMGTPRTTFADNLIDYLFEPMHIWRKTRE